MKNNGPVYNLTTGKINFPIDDRVAIDPEGHISYRVGDHTAIRPTVSFTPFVSTHQARHDVL